MSSQNAAQVRRIRAALDAEAAERRKLLERIEALERQNQMLSAEQASVRRLVDSILARRG